MSIFKNQMLPFIQTKRLVFHLLLSLQCPVQEWNIEVASSLLNFSTSVYSLCVFTQILCLCFQDFADLYDDWYDMKGPRIPSNREDCTSNLSKQVKRGTTQYIFLQSEASSELAESAYSDATLHDFLSTSSFPEQDRSISLGKSPGSLLTDRQFFLGKAEAEERRKAWHQVVEVLESMLGLEHLYPVNASYIEENHLSHVSYKGLKPSMREVTVSWMVEVCLEHECQTWTGEFDCPVAGSNSALIFWPFAP